MADVKEASRGRDETATSGEGGGGGESTTTVIIALLANAAILVAKTIVAVLSGSAAVAAEAAHSFADTGNEAILLLGIKRSERPADDRHQFGHGKERYFWSLIAAVSIFVSGAVFSFLQGIQSLLSSGEGKGESDLLWTYVVLLVSLVFEGISWFRAAKQVRQEAQEEERNVPAVLRHTDDTALKTVVLEDSAAIVGLLIALAGVWLSDVTGNELWDGLASIAIGLTLTLAAWELARSNQRLLVGEAGDPRIVDGLREWLPQQDEITGVEDLRTMRIGADELLVCGRVDYSDDLTVAELEARQEALGQRLRERFPDVSYVYLEPAASQSADLRETVTAPARPTPGTTG
ncbi:MAG: cation diffusion facilitator family transporter [Actinomycetales bacterium]